MKTFKEIAQIALKTEEDGIKIYRKAAKLSINPLTKATFEYLAHEEENHIKIFKEYIEKEQLIDFKPLPRGNPKNEIKKIFDKKTEIDLNRTINIALNKPEIYETALTIEQKSYDFYKSMIEQVEGEKEKKLLTFLCGQENEHFMILQGSKEFLENPGDWFAREAQNWQAFRVRFTRLQKPMLMLAAFAQLSCLLAVLAALWSALSKTE